MKRLRVVVPPIVVRNLVLRLSPRIEILLMLTLVKDQFKSRICRLMGVIKL